MVMPHAPVVDDSRSWRVVFLSHCLLNQNVRYLGGAVCGGPVPEVVDHYADVGVGLCQMPCPEQRAWGGALKPRMTRLYGATWLRRRWARRCFVAVARLRTRRVYRRLARRVAADVADYVSAGFDVVEIVGVAASPSCGVSATLDLDGAVEAMARCDPHRLDAAEVNASVIAANIVPGRGMFVVELRHALDRHHLQVRFREHELMAPTGR